MERERGEIPRLVEELEKSINQLSLSTSGLLDRLGPVSNLDGDSKMDRDRADGQTKAATALGRSLALACSEIDALNAAVNRLEGALQL